MDPDRYHHLVQEFLSKKRIAIQGEDAKGDPGQIVVGKFRKQGVEVIAVNPTFGDDLSQERASSLTRINPRSTRFSFMWTGRKRLRPSMTVSRPKSCCSGCMTHSARELLFRPPSTSCGRQVAASSLGFARCFTLSQPRI